MEIRRSVMARPNLSWRSKSLAVRHWSLAVLVGNCPTTNDRRLTTGSGKKTNRRDHPGGCFLSNAFLPERGRRRRFHQHPREAFLCELCEVLSDLCGQKLLAAESAETAQSTRRILPSPPRPGYAQRPMRSETLLSHYRTRRTENRIQGFEFASAFSIVASASGAMILYPAGFGCRPSSASSFFNSPLSSARAEK